MKYLLDTHTVLWFFDAPEKLSETTFHSILDPANKKYVSIASVWELAIKMGVGKFVFDGGTERFINNIRENGFGLLSIKVKHVRQVETLPLLHRDPFDRVLVASAMTEGMRLITADANIRLYDVHCLW